MDSENVGLSLVGLFLLGLFFTICYCTKLGYDSEVKMAKLGYEKTMMVGTGVSQWVKSK